jgi:hypothetical protein
VQGWAYNNRLYHPRTQSITISPEKETTTTSYHRQIPTTFVLFHVFL